MYDAQIGRWGVVDPLAGMYQDISPYAFVKNNPVNNIEVDGRYFDEANEKKAHKLEGQLDKRIAKLEKQIAKLEKKGKDIGDRKERVTELGKSKTDIADMRSNTTTEFRYGSANDKANPAGVGNPDTEGTGKNAKGDNVVTMFAANNMGSTLHEQRHGGQIARGELTQSTYGVQEEIGAYRAQYAWDGKLSYYPQIDLSNQANLIKLLGGIEQFKITLNNINQITSGAINTMVDKPGLNQKLVYPPAGISIQQFNNN